MKKQYIALVGAALLLSVPVISSATADYGNTDAGAQINLSVADGDLTGTDQDFIFQPSPNVITLGSSTASAFVIAAYNESTLQAPGGEAYGMASDVSGIYTQDLENVESAPTLGTASDSGAFASPWEAPQGAAADAGSAGSGS